jgi:hypothetical protein
MNVDRAIALAALLVAIFFGIPAWLPYLPGVEPWPILKSGTLKLVGMVLMFILAIVAGWKLNDSFRSVRRSHKEDEKKSNDVLKKNRDILDKLDGELRLLLYATFRVDGVYARADEWSSYVSYNENYYEQFLHWKNLANGNVLLTPSESLKELFAMMPDLFNDIGEAEMAKHARDRSGSVVCGHSFFGVPYWWYLKG